MALNFDCNRRKRYLFASLIVCSFFFGTALVQSAFAQQVYKWVDSNGKVQYGEKRNAPTTSKEVNIKPVASTGAPSVSREVSERSTRDPMAAQREHEKLMRKLTRAPESVSDRFTMPKMEKWPEYKISMPAKSGQNENILALGEAVLQSCVSLAVKMHDLGFGPEEAPIRHQYLQTCPGVRIECVSYRKAPEKNVCEPKVKNTEKSITIFQTNP